MFNKFKKWLCRDVYELLNFYQVCCKALGEEVNALRLKNRELSNDLMDADEYIDELEQDVIDNAEYFEQRIIEINEDAEALIEKARKGKKVKSNKKK